jgi:uncharacterized membrane protein YccF (DUF307 family)
MSVAPEGPDWWLASDGRWYPPPHPGYAGSYQTAPAPPDGISLVLNIIWVIFAGFWLALLYLIVGAVLCLLILTIPFGIQCFKLAGFALWPFGRAVVYKPDGGTGWNLVGNIIWIVVAGFWMALAHLITGVALCLTVIGIPLGLGNFKLIPMILFPFGKEVVRRDLAYGRAVVF